MPYSVYSLAYGAAPQEMRLPGRDGKNVEMPYSQTYFTTKAGVELVTVTEATGSVFVPVASEPATVTVQPHAAASASVNN